MSYLIGHFVGRIIMSYIILFVLYFIFSKAQLKPALKKTKKWYTFVFAVVLALLGAASNSYAAVFLL